MSVSILMVGSEVLPFSKTGGLADVLGALPIALGKLGHRVTVVTPKYRGVQAQGSTRTIHVPGVGGAISETRADRGAARAKRESGAGGSPRAIRPRLDLRRRRRLSGQPSAVRISLQGGAGIRHPGDLGRCAVRHSARSRLAGRPRIGLSADALCGRTEAAPDGFDIHDSQPRVSGFVCHRLAGAARAGPGNDVDRRDGVLGADQFSRRAGSCSPISSRP